MEVLDNGVAGIRLIHYLREEMCCIVLHIIIKVFL